MKYLLLIAFFPFICHAQQDTLVISERVGKLIDAREREYLDLFPVIEIFESAAFTARQDDTDSVDVLVQLTTGRTVSYHVIDLLELEQLSKYITQYETLGQSWGHKNTAKYFAERHYSLIRSGIIAKPKLYKPLDVTVTVIGQDQGPVETEGELLYLDSSYLMLKSEEKDNLDPIVFRISEISTIEYSERIPFLTAAAIGWTISTLFLTSVIYANESDGGLGKESSIDFGTAIAGAGMLSLLTHLPITMIAYMFHTTTTIGEDGKLAAELASNELLSERQFYRTGLPPELYQKLYDK